MAKQRSAWARPAEGGCGHLLQELPRVGAKVPRDFSPCHNQPPSLPEVPTTPLAGGSWAGFLPRLQTEGQGAMEQPVGVGTGSLEAGWPCDTG